MNKLLALLLVVLINLNTKGQELTIEKVALSDTTTVASEMQKLAIDIIRQNKAGVLKIAENDRFRIEILAGEHEASIHTIKSLRKYSESNFGHPSYMPHELFAKAKMLQLASGETFSEAYKAVFNAYLTNCTDEQAYTAKIVFTTYDAVAQFTNGFETNYNNISDTSLHLEEALVLLKSYFLYHIYTLTEPVVFKEIEADENKRYIIKEEVIVTPEDGAELAVITARKRNPEPMPAILLFTIYADASNYDQAVLAASKGYVGVVANSRGKRQSKNAIEPLVHEYKDVYAVIDWISKQAWNNKKVGMYGGSYDGFAQWASMKEKLHPALKTIIPSVSIAPGINYPMENNIFFNYPYKWIPYATSNKFLDDAANSDRKRWNELENEWFVSGKAFNKMDSIEGTSRPLFQEWISHPSYDSYWQNMIPYKDEYAHIDIPVLSTTGYYDDAQRGAIYYYLEHVQYNPDAEHYLLIGPYDHWGAQFASSTYLRGYQIDDTAQINIRQGLAYDWFDYILKNGEKPALLKDKVNFQVMGENTWLNKPYFSEMSNDSLVFYLGTTKNDDQYELTNEPGESKPLRLEVDFADRTKMNNEDYYPWPIVKDSINLHDGLVFISKPLKRESIMSGSFTGELIVTINKKDFDFAVNLYELTADGKYFHLSNYMGRASYAKNTEHRELLIPNKLTHIRFDNTQIICKKIAKESRIVVVINANKNSSGQINYGTGKDVSSESIQDAGVPLTILVNAGSKIYMPVFRTDEQ